MRMLDLKKSLAGKNAGHIFPLLLERTLLAILCSPAGQNSMSHYFTSRAFCILTRATSPLSGHEAALYFNLYKCQECLEEKERAWTKGTGCNNEYESEKKNCNTWKERQEWLAASPSLYKGIYILKLQTVENLGTSLTTFDIYKGWILGLCFCFCFYTCIIFLDPELFAVRLW